MDSTILLAAAINGLLIGGIYTLVASGLTLIYGVLHIINFAHGSMLMLGMFGVYFLLMQWGVDPYLSLLVMVPAMFALGYVLYRGLMRDPKDPATVISHLSVSEVPELKATGVVDKGMIPKVDSAVSALKSGVSGSGPNPANSAQRASSSADSTSIRPNRRGSR